MRRANYECPRAFRRRLTLIRKSMNRHDAKVAKDATLRSLYRRTRKPVHGALRIFVSFLPMSHFDLGVLGACEENTSYGEPPCPRLCGLGEGFDGDAEPEGLQAGDEAALESGGVPLGEVVMA